VVSLLQANAVNKQIQLTGTIEKNTFIKADKNMINTILRNLVSNAIKFTGLNGKINVNAKVADDSTIVSVSDTGIGLDKEDIEKLFRIDVQFVTKGTAQEAGTGLGLVICKEMIEKHQGKIWVESAKFKGSTFYFSIPQK